MLNRSSTADYLSNALGIFVGAGRDHSYESLSAATTINLRRLYRFRAAEAEPAWFEMLALIGVLGPEFANLCMAPAGVTGAHRSLTNASHMAFWELTSRFNYRLAEFFSDYCLDHAEKARLEPIIAEIVTHGGGLIGDRTVQRIVTQ